MESSKRWVIGIHNGIIDNWYKHRTKDMEVDSEAFFYPLAHGKPEDIGELSGWAACVWWDSKDGFHTYAHEAPLKCFRTRRALFMVSQEDWLIRQHRPVFGKTGQLPEDKIFRWDIETRQPIHIKDVEMTNSWSKFWRGGAGKSYGTYGGYYAYGIESRHGKSKNDYETCTSCGKVLRESETTHIWLDHIQGDYCSDCSDRIMHWYGSDKKKPGMDEIECEHCGEIIKRGAAWKIEDLELCSSCKDKFDNAHLEKQPYRCKACGEELYLAKTQEIGYCFSCWSSGALNCGECTIDLETKVGKEYCDECWNSTREKRISDRLGDPEETQKLLPMPQTIKGP
jgi:hypothetical protein